MHPSYLQLFTAALVIGLGFTLGCRIIDPILARISESIIVGLQHRLQAAVKGQADAKGQSAE